MSETLKCILKHWRSEVPKEGVVSLPFDIEAFCAENDKKFEQARDVSDTNQAHCACLSVVYDPEDIGDSWKRERWKCSSCGSEFQRKRNPEHPCVQCDADIEPDGGFCLGCSRPICKKHTVYSKDMSTPRSKSGFCSESCAEEYRAQF